MGRLVRHEQVARRQALHQQHAVFRQAAGDDLAPRRVGAVARELPVAVATLAGAERLRAHYLDFMPRLAKAFPRQEHPAGCFTDGLNAGICRSQELPEAEVLRRLDAIAPGFGAWSQRYGTAR